MKVLVILAKTQNIREFFLVCTKMKAFVGCAGRSSIQRPQIKECLIDQPNAHLSTLPLFNSSTIHNGGQGIVVLTCVTLHPLLFPVCGLSFPCVWVFVLACVNFIFYVCAFLFSHVRALSTTRVKNEK